MARKTFNEKLNDSKNFPEIVEVIDIKAVERFGGPKMLIAPPLFYDSIMKKIPKGKLITSDRIRSFLAKENGADYTCQLTAGIFINIVANASEERDIDETPYWRTLKKDGELNEKYPGGIDGQKSRLEMEQAGKVSRWNTLRAMRVLDYFNDIKFGRKYQLHREYCDH